MASFRGLTKMVGGKLKLLISRSVLSRGGNCEGNGRNVPGHSKRARTYLACRAEKRNRYGCLEHI